MPSKTLSLALVWALVAPLGGCAVHKPPERVEPPVQSPAAFSQQGELQLPNRWWQSFGDEQLNALVEESLAGNLDLRAAWARVQQAEALARQAGAELYPWLNAEGTARRNKFILRLGPLGNLTDTVNLFTAGLAASYEVDLWGRVRSQARAGQLALAASREDAYAAAITVSATAAELWYSLVEQRAQQKLLQSQIETSRKLLELVELRFRQGQVPAMDVHQQRQQLAALHAQEPILASNIELLEHQIAVLVGRQPRAPVAATSVQLPQLPELPATGLPADLLARRPDVRAAHLRVLAANYRLASAIAQRLPALRLGVSGQYQSEKFDQVFDNFIWSIAAGLTAPIFEGGRLQAETDRNRAAVEELTLLYGNAVLTAYREVEDALTQERKQREHLAALETQLGEARAALEHAQERYARGLTEYVSALTALQSTQEVERLCLRARKNLVSYRIQLCRALAGSWDEKPRQPS